MRSYLLGGACAASMLLALTPVAQAADIDVGPEPMVGLGWYVSVFGGWSLPKDEEIFVEANPVYYDFLDAEIELDNGFMVGAAVGAQINEWLRGEVEISGHWHDAEGDAFTYFAALQAGTYDVNGEENALFALANLWVDLPIGSVFRPYIGGGIGFGRLDVDVAFETTNGSDVSIIDDDDWGFAWQIGGGVAFAFSENIAIDVGYRYKHINNADLKFDDELDDYFVSVGGGGLEEDEVKKDYKSHNILVGLRFLF